MCMALSKGYCIRWVVYHTECVFHTKCVVVVVVGDVVETEVVRNCSRTSRESMKPLDTLSIVDYHSKYIYFAYQYSFS